MPDSASAGEPGPLFITGTGTGVGKSWVTCMMLRALNQMGIPAVGYKPISCGDRQDAHALLAAGAAGPTVDEINPLALQAPAAPWTAARLGNQSVDTARLVDGFHHLRARFPVVLVEGAGGWEVPITASLTMADLAAQLGTPTLIVVDNRLGALNLTILTARAITARGIPCRGLVLNHLADCRDTASITNRAALEEFLHLPVLADILHGEDSAEPAWVLEAVTPPPTP